MFDTYLGFTSPAKPTQAGQKLALVAARDAQRSGNLALFGTLTEQSEKLAADIDRLTAKR